VTASATPAARNGHLDAIDCLESLSKFCLLANTVILAFYDERGSCIFSTGVVCDVLAYYGFNAKPLRVEAAVFDTKPGGRGVVLGGFSEPMRRKAAGKGAWHGHLVSLVDDDYLIDTTLIRLTIPSRTCEPSRSSFIYPLRTGFSVKIECLTIITGQETFLFSGQAQPCATLSIRDKMGSSMQVILKHVGGKILFRLLLLWLANALLEPIWDTVKPSEAMHKVLFDHSMADTCQFKGGSKFIIG
jgi:hypothetical protein